MSLEATCHCSSSYSNEFFFFGQLLVVFPSLALGLPHNQNTFFHDVTTATITVTITIMITITLNDTGRKHTAVARRHQLFTRNSTEGGKYSWGINMAFLNYIMYLKNMQ